MRLIFSSRCQRFDYIVAVDLIQLKEKIKVVREGVHLQRGMGIIFPSGQGTHSNANRCAICHTEESFRRILQQSPLYINYYLFVCRRMDS